MTDVKALAGWDGWCDPCGTERPLVLTETGPRGVRAWARGVSWEDRGLGLYCRVCGQHQVVPLRDEDDPVVVVVVPEVVLSLTRVGLSAVTLSRPQPVGAVARTPATPAPVAVPPQRAGSPSSLASPDSETQLDLVAAGLVA